MSDEQAAGDVADYYLQRMAYGTLDQRIQNRINALAVFAQRAAGAPATPAPASGAGLPPVAVALPSAVPSFAPQELDPPTFPAGDGPAKRLADQGSATLTHRIVDAKSPTARPLDQIDITRGSVQWHIDLLTGLITFRQQHSVGVIENGAERAHEVAEAFLQRHGGLPGDATEVNPVYKMTQGDSASVPKPTSITFVWRHKDPSILGADAILVTVTPGAASFAPATPAPGGGLEVTAYTRLWRKAGKTLTAGKTPPMGAARALALLARSGSLPPGAKIDSIVFGGLRAAASAAPRSTEPAWGFRAGDAWYTVDAIDGAVSGSAALGVPSDAIALVPKPTASAQPTAAAAPAATATPVAAHAAPSAR